MTDRPYWPHSNPQSAAPIPTQRAPSAKCTIDKRRTLRPDETMTCTNCLRRLDDTLADILVLYALLPAVILPGSVEVDDMPHGHRVDAPAPVRLDVVDYLDERVMLKRGLYPTDEHRGVLGVLEPWGRLVCEERGLSTPREATVSGEVALLRRHLAWVGEQPWIDEMADELFTLHRELQATCGETKPRPIGRCPAMVESEDGEGRVCGALLYAPTYGDTVRCRRCAAEWPRARWLMLGKLIEEGETA